MLQGGVTWRAYGVDPEGQHKQTPGSDSEAYKAAGACTGNNVPSSAHYLKQCCIHE